MLIRRKILNPKDLSSDEVMEKVANYLQSRGFRIGETNNGQLNFRGYHSNTTHTGRNFKSILKPILKGRVSVSSQDNQNLCWRLSVDSLLVRIVLFGGLIYVLLGLYGLTDILQICIAILFTVILGIYLVSTIYSRIETITEDIDLF